MSSLKAYPILVAALVLAGCASHDERPVKESDVPKAVRDSVAKAYPSAKTISWSQEGDEYEANLDDSGKKINAEFASDGTLKEVSEETSLDATPDPVKKGVADSKYAKATVLVAKKETEGGVTKYKFAFKDGAKGYSVAFSPEGKLLKEKELSKEKLDKLQKEHGSAPAGSPPAAGVSTSVVKEREIALPGEGSWDYVTVDPAAQRLYVAHATTFDVIDLVKNEKIGAVEGIDGAHGTAIVSELKRGFCTSGKNNKLVVFDLETLKTTNTIDTGVGPDAVLSVTSVGEVWTMNHKGGTITCIDAKSLEVKATIEVGGALEFAREDAARGFVYLLVEDKDTMVAVDARKHEITAKSPVAPGKAPAGLAFDEKDGLLFVGCDNKKLVVMEAATGKVVTALDSGEHCDGCCFDPETGAVFASCRGNSYGYHVKDAKTFEPLGTLEAGKTCTLDPKTHKLYITSGKRGEKDSVKVLIFTQK